MKTKKMASQLEREEELILGQSFYWMKDNP